MPQLEDEVVEVASRGPRVMSIVISPVETGVNEKCMLELG